MQLPPNLYPNGEYWSWRNPTTGKKYGLGKDRDEAIKQAKQANAFIQAPQLTQRIVAPHRTLGGYIPIYIDALDTKDLAENTRYGRKRAMEAVKAKLGGLLIGPRQEDAVEITRQCSDFLKEYSRDGKHRMAKSMRSVLIDLFADMAAAGWLAVNPARVIKLQPAKVMRSRLTLDAFKAIYEVAGDFDPWVRRSLELGLVAIQRREDTARMGFRDVQEGRLCVVQQKTKTRLRIPLTLRLDAMGWTLGDVIARCRDSVVSRRLLHHTVNKGQAKAGKGVHPQTLGTAFAECRDLAKIELEDGKRPPSFHELRSLGIRLYQAQGYDPQLLAGHKDAETTAVYSDERSSKWIDVAA